VVHLILGVFVVENIINVWRIAMMLAIIKQSIYATTLACLLFPAMGISATLEEIDLRLKKLEGEAGITREETDDITAHLKNSMTVTGYADTEYVTTNGSDKSGFRLHHFSVFMKKQVSEDLRFFSETEYEDAPYISAVNTGVSGKLFVEAVNFDYQWRLDTSMRVGRFFTPAGIWSVDHYPPFVLTQQRPQHIRAIFPQLVDGAAISGRHAVDSAFVSYDLYVGNGETPNFDGSGDSNTTMASGLKVNVALPIGKQFELGATVYHDKMAAANDSMEPKKEVYGAHAKIEQGDFGLQAEYADGKYEPTVSPATNQPYHKKGYYAQFDYDIHRWTLAYRYDFFSSNTSTSISNSGAKINSAIVNYRVNKNVVLKLEHHLAKVLDPAQNDYYKNIASIAVNLD
jgi:hypothetical protein